MQIAKTNTELEKNPDLEMLMKDVAALKRDIGALAEHLKSGVVDGVLDAGRNAATRVSDETRRLYGNLAEQGQHSVKALGRQVEEKPVMSLLIAFALGLVGSRLLSR